MPNITGRWPTISFEDAEPWVAVVSLLLTAAGFGKAIYDAPHLSYCVNALDALAKSGGSA